MSTLKQRIQKKIKELFSGLVELLSACRRVQIESWKAHRGGMITALILSILIPLFTFGTSGAFSWFLNEITHAIKSPTESNNVLFVFLIMMTLFLLEQYIFNLKGYIERLNWSSSTILWDSIYLGHKKELDPATLDDPDFKKNLDKATDRGLWSLTQLNESIFNSLQTIIPVFLGMGVLIWFDWRICLIVIVSRIPKLFIGLLYGQTSWDIWDEDTVTRMRYNHLRNHFMSDKLTELRLYQNTNLFFKRIKDMLSAFEHKSIAVEKKKLIYQTIAEGLSMGVTGLVMFHFTTQVLSGVILIGTLNFIWSSIDRLEGSLSNFLTMIAKQYEWSKAVNSFFVFLDAEAKIKNPKNAFVIGDDAPPRIEFKNVTFSYKPDLLPTLQNFSLTIEPGDKLAIVGINGAGKSTFIKLLCRFYDPTEGSILVNGRDLRTIDLQSWYTMMATVFQDFSRYHFPVREVIGLGRTSRDIKEEDILNSAQASESNTFIELWKEQYDQVLGPYYDGGVDPSGGQWQRLALARMFYRNARLLILDEPTSAVDAQAEAKIFDWLQSLPKDKTAIFISHRFSTVRSANKICVIKEGRNIEYGSHEELIAKNGVYAELFRSQAEKYQ